MPSLAAVHDAIKNLVSAFSPDVEAQLLLVHAPTAKVVERYVERWPLEALTLLREIGVLLLVEENQPDKAMALIRETFDPRSPRDVLVAADRLISEMPQRERAERAITRLEEEGVLGLSLAYRLGLVLKGVRVRRGMGLLTRDGILSCGDTSVSLERLTMASESLLFHDPSWAQEALKAAAPRSAIVDLGSGDLTHQVS